MKIRVLSDLHLDLNDAHCLELNDKDVFTVICGDTSGYLPLGIEWIKKNVKRGLCIAGNHVVYNRVKDPAKVKTIQELKDQLHEEFPETGEVTFLDVNVGVYKKEVNGILFLGSTMYTDYNLPVYSTPAENDQLINMRMAAHPRQGMNDWYFAPYSKSNYLGQDNEFTTSPLKPEHYLRWFNRTIERFEEALAENEKSDSPKPVVILTHHCPTTACLQSKYNDNGLSASYVSNLEDFIERHTSIKCWCCGHIHAQKVIVLGRKDGSECKVVMNPRGYHSYFEDMDFNPDIFIDTETWEIIKTPLSKSQKAKLEKRMKDLELACALFL